MVSTTLKESTVAPLAGEIWGGAVTLSVAPSGPAAASEAAGVDEGDVGLEALSPPQAMARARVPARPVRISFFMSYSSDVSGGALRSAGAAPPQSGRRRHRASPCPPTPSAPPRRPPSAGTRPRRAAR